MELLRMLFRHRAISDVNKSKKRNVGLSMMISFNCELFALYLRQAANVFGNRLLLETFVEDPPSPPPTICMRSLCDGAWRFLAVGVFIKKLGFFLALISFGVLIIEETKLRGLDAWALNVIRGRFVFPHIMRSRIWRLRYVSKFLAS